MRPSLSLWICLFKRQPETEASISKLKEKIAALQNKMRDLKEQEILLEKTPDKQISITDPDARAMSTGGKTRGTVGYNLQAAMDPENHLILVHEVPNAGNDRELLFLAAGWVQIIVPTFGGGRVAAQPLLDQDHMLPFFFGQLLCHLPDIILGGI